MSKVRCPGCFQKYDLDEIYLEAVVNHMRKHAKFATAPEDELVALLKKEDKQ